MIGIMIDQKLSKFEKSIKYTFDFLFETLGIQHRYVDTINYQRNREILLLYSLLPPAKEEIIDLAAYGLVIFMQVDSDLLLHQKITKEFIENNTREIKLFNTFPVISTRRFDNPMEIRRSEKITWGEINFDIIANLYYHLSGYDEKLGGSLDDLGRYSDCSLSFFSYTRTPYVNYLLWMMDNYIKEIAGQIPALSITKKELWPGGEDFAYCMSHNVDRLQKWNTRSLLSSTFTDIGLVFSLNFKQLFRGVGEKIKYLATNYEVYWKFEKILGIYEDYPVKSTWFFGAMDDSDDIGEIDYLFDDVDLQEEIRNIIGKKNEVSLLTDINSERNKEVEGQQKRLSNVITGRVKGVRNITGKYDNDTYPSLYDYCDFLYNSGKMLNEQVGFRNGTAIPYKMFISSEERVSKHWQLPPVFSDNYLQTSKRKFVSQDIAKDLIRALIKAVQEINGLIVFNFSLSRFNDIAYMPQLLEYTLRFLKDKKAFTGTMGEVVDWWEKRKQVMICQENDDVIIVSNQNIKSLTVSLWTTNKIKKVTGATSSVKNNYITLTDIRKNSEIIIHTEPDEQMYINIAEEDMPDKQ